VVKVRFLNNIIVCVDNVVLFLCPITEVYEKIIKQKRNFVNLRSPYLLIFLSSHKRYLLFFS